MLLHQRWLQTLARTPDAIALREMAPAREMTFRELDAAAAALQPSKAVAFPQGKSIDFFIETLAAWKHGQLLCPLDGPAPQQTPQPAWLAAQGIVHAKLTSGSTGEPKLVLFTAEQLAADADQIVATMGLRADWPTLAAISLAHSYGFSNVVLPLLLHGIPAILVPQPFPQAVQSAMTGPVTLPAVPALWKAWHAAGILQENIRLAISAGAPLPQALQQAIQNESGIQLHNFYGSSECGGIAYNGKAVHGVRLTTDPATSQLHVHSAAVAQCTWPNANDEIRPGEFITQDLASLAPDGTLTLEGRLGDIINLAGRKLHPATVEEILRSLPGVTEALVVGLPSTQGGRGEELAAIVNLDSAQTTLTEVRNATARLLPAWQCPRQWIQRPDLLPNVRGKLSRHEWRGRVSPA
jgi:long-chain acyl-CoA synthetase